MPSTPNKTALIFSAEAAAMYESFGPNMPPAAVAPGLGAPPGAFPPPSMESVAAVGSVVAVVVCVLVLLPGAAVVLFPGAAVELPFGLAVGAALETVTTTVATDVVV